MSLSPRTFERDRAHQFAVIAIPVLTTLFVLVLVVQQVQFERLRIQNTQLREDTYSLQVQNAFYKKAYELTLDDIRQLSTAYNGRDPRYDALAGELREQEIGKVLGNVSGVVQYTLKNEGLWREYAARGITNTSCLAPPTPADTISDDVLVTVRVAGENSSFSMYIDGTAMGGSSVQGSVQYQAQVHLSAGEHELDILSSIGNIEVQEIFLDTLPLPLTSATQDAGRAWSVFDCKQATPGAKLDEPGAVRILVRKQ